MKFILVLHSTTEWNLARRIQGQTDTSLSPQGKAETKELARLLSDFDINLIVSSDLKRTNETAEIINATLEVSLRLEPRLRECCCGNIEGLTREQAIEKYGSSMALNWEEPYHVYDFRPCGGEHHEDVFTRHIEVLKALADEKSESAILLVGHARGMSTLLAGLGYPSDLKRGEYRIIEHSLP